MSHEHEHAPERSAPSVTVAKRDAERSTPEGVTTSNSARVKMLRARGAGAGGPSVQRLAGAPSPTQDTGRVHAAARAGVAGAGHVLPHLAAIQRSFGEHDVSGVTAHTGPEAKAGSHAMDARAFAFGNHVAFAQEPSLHDAAHEAAHVVQQRAGVVPSGVGAAGDTWERHADAVADRVTQGKSAEGLLHDAVKHRGSEDATHGGAHGSVQRLQQPASQQGYKNTSKDYLRELFGNAHALVIPYYASVKEFARMTKGEPLLPYNKINQPALKTEERAQTKAAEDYEGDYSKLGDLLRATIVYKRVSHMMSAWRKLVMNPVVDVGKEHVTLTHVRSKNRVLNEPYDFLVNIKFTFNGIAQIVELQLTTEDVQDFKKSKAHKLYAITRDSKRSPVEKAEAWRVLREGYYLAHKRDANKAILPMGAKDPDELEDEDEEK